MKPRGGTGRIRGIEGPNDEARATSHLAPRGGTLTAEGRKGGGTGSCKDRTNHHVKGQSALGGRDGGWNGSAHHTWRAIQPGEGGRDWWGPAELAVHPLPVYPVPSIRGSVTVCTQSTRVWRCSRPAGSAQLSRSSCGRFLQLAGAPSGRSAGRAGRHRPSFTGRPR